MIVPGEASESDEDSSGLPELASEATPDGDGRSSQQQPAISAPTIRPRQLASQLGLTLGSMTEAVGKQLGGLRAASLNEELPAKSLLHQRLFESNSTLRRRSDSLTTEMVARIPHQLGQLLDGCARTQAYFQDAVLSMQQASHYCAEAVESMEEFVDTGKRVKFPIA